jgi:hypothetical protein
VKLDSRLAKTIMENEEGLNHLWIQFSHDLFDYKFLQIKVKLPHGMYRLPNLNGHHEDGAITIDPSTSHDVLLEIFTQDATSCGQRTITVDLIYSDGRTRNQLSYDITATLVSDEDMDNVVIDDQVVNRLKELRSTSTSEPPQVTDAVSVRPKPVAKANEFSYLEEKYRIDY